MPSAPNIVEWNWAQTHRFDTLGVQQPATVSALQSILTTARSAHHTVRGVGSRHSFTNIADGQVMVELSQMPEQFVINDDKTSATVNAAMTYSRLAELLVPFRLAVHNLASLPHITIAGATATGTHGSGDDNANLATSIRAVDLVTANGDVRHMDRTDPDFAAAPLSLGGLGVVTAVELDLVPRFDLRQLVHNALSWEALDANFDALFGSAYSVSLFTNWVDHLQLWTKERVDSDPVNHSTLHDGSLAIERHHPIPGVDASACTHQGQEPGRWDERLPHFRAGAVPSVGAEVQSEIFVARRHATAAITALRTIGPQMVPHLMASEIRTVRSDDLWLSPQFERDCVAFHFTWHHDMPAALAMAQLIASTLAPFDPLPHWGKVFDPSQFDFDALYPRLGDAQRAFVASDPTGTFRNAWFDTIFA